MGCGSRRRSRGGSGWGSRRCEVWRRCGVGWRRGVASGGDAVWRRVETRCGVGWRRGARRLACGGAGHEAGPSRRRPLPSRRVLGARRLRGHPVMRARRRCQEDDRASAPTSPGPSTGVPPVPRPPPRRSAGPRLSVREQRIAVASGSSVATGACACPEASGVRSSGGLGVSCCVSGRPEEWRPASGVWCRRRRGDAGVEPVLRDMLVRAGHCSRRQAGRSRSPRRKAGHGWDAGGGPRRGGRGGASSSRCRSRLRMTG